MPVMRSQRPIDECHVPINIHEVDRVTVGTGNIVRDLVRSVPSEATTKGVLVDVGFLMCRPQRQLLKSVPMKPEDGASTTKGVSHLPTLFVPMIHTTSAFPEPVRSAKRNLSSVHLPSNICFPSLAGSQMKLAPSPSFSQAKSVPSSAATKTRSVRPIFGVSRWDMGTRDGNTLDNTCSAEICENHLTAIAGERITSSAARNPLGVESMITIQAVLRKCQHYSFENRSYFFMSSLRGSMEDSLHEQSSLLPSTRRRLRIGVPI